MPSVELEDKEMKIDKDEIRFELNSCIAINEVVETVIGEKYGYNDWELFVMDKPKENRVEIRIRFENKDGGFAYADFYITYSQILKYPGGDSNGEKNIYYEAVNKHLSDLKNKLESKDKISGKNVVHAFFETTERTKRVDEFNEMIAEGLEREETEKKAQAEWEASFGEGEGKTEKSGVSDETDAIKGKWKEFIPLSTSNGDLTPKEIVLVEHLLDQLMKNN